tara:strand:- start:790 stop:939 length:150 start_codon:yes stop_codon:yes gene_type:complete
LSTKNKTWKLIQKWREHYSKSPNGWPISKMIGADYIEGRQLRQKEKKRA